ncbi:hypothetical protein ABH930_006957 [Kitasatospora sp. GAS204A]|nr:hypothetical protein [Kitasatospora sp. GAS204B]
MSMQRPVCGGPAGLRAALGDPQVSGSLAGPIGESA